MLQSIRTITMSNEALQSAIAFRIQALDNDQEKLQKETLKSIGERIDESRDFAFENNRLIN